MSYFKFSAKLSMFYEVMKSATVDIIFFITIFFFNTCVFALIAHLCFGVTEESLKSLSESMLSIFLLIVGHGSPFNWDTTLVELRSLYGVLFTLNKVFLLNMFIAVITAHYIEYYIESTADISIVKCILDVIKNKYLSILSDKDEDDKPKKWYIRIKDYFVKLFLNTVKKYLEEGEKVEPTFNTVHLKKITQGDNNILVAHQDIIDIVLKPKNAPRNLNYKYSELQERMKDVYFWVELIDTTLRRIKMQNQGIFFYKKGNRDIIKLQLRNQPEDQQILYDDKIIQFCMSEERSKMKKWKAKISQIKN